MATLDRIDTYRPWTPSAAGMTTEAETYVGRHRRTDVGRASLLRMFYSPRHRAR